jgi:hypothetical protein
MWPFPIVNHQQEICEYLQRRRFGESEVAMREAFLFEEAGRLEQTGPLLMRAKSFLQENSILFPADSTLRLTDLAASMISSSQTLAGRPSVRVSSRGPGCPPRPRMSPPTSPAALTRLMDAS